MRQAWFRTLGVVALAIAHEACHRGGTGGGTKPLLIPAHDPKHRIVTISPVDSAKCEVDFPVVYLRNKEGHDIQWMSADRKTRFWVSFLNLGDDSHIPSSYQPLNPFAPRPDPVEVDPTNGAGPYDVKDEKHYYKYAIYNQYPGNDPHIHRVVPCLFASFPFPPDTGLDVGDD